MQLKKKSVLGNAIASAACGLLGALPSTHVVAADATVPATAPAKGPWTVDTALLYYGESDGRVKDKSLRMAIQRAFDEDRALSIDIAVDSLTGASPTGAVPSDVPQTFTRPSAGGTYQAAPGQLPLDDTFKDTRFAIAADWLQPIGEYSRVDVGVSASTEYDYQHLGANARLEFDFNQRNTTLFVGGAYGQETIDPVGGAPIPLAPMQGVGNSSSKLGSDSKNVIDGLVGISQILSRRSALTLTYSYSQQSGYLNDPYKILTVVDPVTGRPVAGPSPGLGSYLYDSRPDSRAKHGLFGEWRYAFDRDSMALGFRLMSDDWGVKSSTAEARYRWNLGARSYLEPQIRFYHQGAADFYHSYLLSGQPLPQFASADYRLAQMNAVTTGVKYGRRTGMGDFSVRLEYYKQTTQSADPKIGVLANYDLVPSMSAVIVQFGYKINF